MFEVFTDEMITGKCPKQVRIRTKENMERYNMDLYDAFKDAVRSYSRPSVKMQLAYYYEDFREYIPSAYLPEFLDFKEYPLKYVL